MAGSLIRSLQPLVRENYDYSEFLLKFAARLEERMQINEDEFDYIFYTYGLRLFKRVPLIEPLEYKEKYLIREFVVAIDTSESCEITGGSGSVYFTFSAERIWRYRFLPGIRIYGSFSGNG